MDQSQNSKSFKIFKDWDWQSKLLLKEKFGQLTLADVKFEIGKESELLHRLGRRLNMPHQEIRRILTNLNLV